MMTRTKEDVWMCGVESERSDLGCVRLHRQQWFPLDIEDPDHATLAW